MPAQSQNSRYVSEIMKRMLCPTFQGRTQTGLLSRPWLALLVLSFGLLGLPSCVGDNPIRELSARDGDALRLRLQNAATGANLSEVTQQVLYGLGLLRHWERRPWLSYEGLLAAEFGAPEFQRQAAIAEVEYALAAKPGTQSTEALPGFLTAAARALSTLRSLGEHTDAGSGTTHRLIQIYNRALAHAADLMQAEFGPPENWSNAVAGPWRLRWAPVPNASPPLHEHQQVPHHPVWNPSRFSWVEDADAVRFRGLRLRHRREGIGAPLIARIEPSAIAAWNEVHRPSLGSWVSATLVMTEVNWETREIQLTLADPWESRVAPIPDLRLKVAADFATPYARLVAKSSWAEFERDGLLDPLDVEGRSGAWLMRPLDPEKIPLVLIHGLYSSPLTWFPLVQDLLGDEEVRRHYQIVHFMYPTGFPLLTNARHFREAMQQLHSAANRRAEALGVSAKPWDEMMLVGHSMGGLLASMATRRVGRRFWNAIWKVDESALNVTDQQREFLVKTLVPEPLDFVKRVVFVAVPHRGSKFSTNLVRTIGSWLIERPDEDSLVEDIVKVNSEYLTPKVLELRSWTSLDDLSADSILLKTLLQAPFPANFPFHSILGSEAGEDSPHQSDGVVKLRSADISGANSRLVVRSDHKVHQKRAAILEIRKILRTHLGHFAR